MAKEAIEAVDKTMQHYLEPGIVDALTKTHDKSEVIQLLKKAGADAKKEVEKGIIPSTPIYKIIVSLLGAVGIVALIGSVVLVSLEKTPIDAIIAVGSAAVGGLAGALTVPRGGGETE